MRRGCFGSASIFRRNFPDQHVHAAVERLEPPMGEGVHESVAANHPPWPTGEHPQHSKLAACERDSLAGFEGKDAGVEVEDEFGGTAIALRLLARA